jgi:hypothetical protein
LSQFVSQYYSWIVLTLAAAMLVSLIALAVYYSQSRRASFFFLREEAARKTRYILWGFLALLAVTVILLLTPPPDFPMGRQPLTTPVAALPTATPAAEASTASPEAAAPVLSPTAAPAPTSTPQPSPTPSPAPIASPVQGASFYDIILARGISGDNKPLSPADTFPQGGNPIYLFFHYQGMKKGVRWTQVWSRGTTELFRETTSWEWGEVGMAWLFFTPDGGYIPGEYEAQLYIEDNLQLAARFRVQ